MTVTIINIGNTLFEIDEILKLNSVIYTQINEVMDITKIWALAKIERANSEPHTEPFTVYASHNMFREGWCVLAKDRNKIVHLS